MTATREKPVTHIESLRAAPPVLGESIALGPSRVVAFEGPDVVVEISEGVTRTAKLAMAFPYRPVIGDLLLVIAERGQPEAYVIGVLAPSGRTSLEFTGDVDVRAVGGSLRLAGDRGVQIEAPSLDVAAREVRVVAQKLVQSCSSILQRAKDLFTVEAKEVHQLVEGDLLSRSKSATLVAEEKVVFNGKQIHLG